MKKLFISGVIFTLMIILLVVPVHAATIGALTIGDNTVSGSGDGWEWDATNKILTLNGLTISTSSATGLTVPSGTTIILKGTSTNTITLTSASNATRYGIQCAGTLTITGTGTLIVTGGNVNGNGDKSTYGIYATGDILITGGTISATGGNDIAGSGNRNTYGIYTSNNIEISNTAVTARSGNCLVANATPRNSYGISASQITITNSTVTAIGGEVSAEASLFSTANANSYGINGTTIINSGKVTATGGSAINEGGVGTDHTKSYGINGTMTINDGTVDAIGGNVGSSGDSRTSNGITGNNITISGGTVTAQSINNTASATRGIEGNVTITNGTLYITIPNVNDPNSHGIYGSTTISGGTILVVNNNTSRNDVKAFSNPVTPSASSNKPYWYVTGIDRNATITGWDNKVTVPDSKSFSSEKKVFITYIPPVNIAIDTHPQNETVAVGETATFNVAGSASSSVIPLVNNQASGGAFTYQWQVCTDGTTWANVSGATSNTLTVSNPTLTNNGNQYRCVVGANGAVDITSNPATLTVYSYTATISPPEPQDFGIVAVGYPTVEGKTFTVTNTGTGTLTNLTASLTGANASSFTISTALSSNSVASGDTATITVTPNIGLEIGEYTANLVISGDNGISFTVHLTFTVHSYKVEVTPPSKDFTAAEYGYGDQESQSEVFSIENTGTDTLTNISATISNDALFEISTVLSSNSITIGNTVTVSVKPKTNLAVGTHTADLVIKQGETTLAIVPLRFQVLDTYTATISPSGSQDFGIVAVDYPTVTGKTFTVTNTGTGTLTGISASLSNGSPFEITAEPAVSVSAGASGNTTTVTVRPKTGLAAGSYTDTLTITGDNGIILTVELTFTVHSYIATINPTDHTFTSVEYGYSVQSAKTFTITNTGTGILTGVSATIENDSNSAFTISTALSPVSIAQDGSAAVSVRPATGLDADTYTADLVITANELTAPLTVTLTFTVNKKIVELDNIPTFSKVYGNNGTSTTGSVSFKNSVIVSNTVSAVITDTNLNVGTGKAYSYTVTLTNPNYTFMVDGNETNKISGTSTSGEITKAVRSDDTRTLSVNKENSLTGTIDLTSGITGLADAGLTETTTYISDITSDNDSVINGTPSVQSGVLSVTVNSNAAVGSAATVTVTVKSQNYADFNIVVTVSITDKTVADITGVSVADKTYDGTSASPAGTPVVTSVYGTESVMAQDLIYTYTSTDGGNYSSTTPPANAGQYQLIISVSDTNQAYTGASNPIEFTISPKEVTATITGTTTKDYDRTPNFTGSVQIADGGKVGDDDVDVTATSISFDSADAGSRTIAAAGISLTGSDAYNYKLLSSEASISGTINPITIFAAINATATKVYDGTTTVPDSSLELTGVLAGDSASVTVTGYTISFDSPDAGNRTITAAGTVTLSGSKAHNYTLSASIPSVSGKIEKASINLTDAVAASLTYKESVAESKEVVLADILSDFLDASKSYGSITYGLPVTTHNDNAVANVLLSGGKLTFDVLSTSRKDGFATVTIEVASTNYSNFTLTVNITFSEYLMNVSFNANGGSGSKAPVPVGKDSQYTLPQNPFGASGLYIFAGWKVNNSGATLQPGDKITVSSDITLYAQWTVNPLVLITSIIGNQGSGTSSPPKDSESDPKSESSDSKSTQTPAPAQSKYYIFVDDVKCYISSESVKDGATYVTLNQTEFKKEIESAEHTLTIPVHNDSNTVSVYLTVGNINDMAEKGIVLSVQFGNVTYTIPASAIDTKAIMEQLGAKNPEDVIITITITKTLGEANQVYIENTVTSSGCEAAAPALMFSITASYNSDITAVDIFTAYATRKIEITAEQAKKTTTAVIVEPDGTLRHVPTRVYQENGKWYAEIKSVTNSTYVLIYNAQTFTDAEDKWYEDRVYEMASRKIMLGTGNNMFEGDRDITRAEFAMIIVKALGLPVDDEPEEAFTDVKSTDWYCSAVYTAYKYGIINGRGEGIFDPQTNITWQEAMIMIRNAAKVAGYSNTDGSESPEAYPDASSVAEWAEDAVEFYAGSGLFIYEGLLRPTENITRAQSAVAIFELLLKANFVS